MTEHQREAGADVPEDVLRGVKADPQAVGHEARGPEHDGAYLEQVTCVLGAREDPGRRGREVSKQSAEVGIPQERRSQEVSQFSAESRGREGLAGALAGRIQMHAWGRLRSSAREKERWDTRGLTANNNHTGGVEGPSGPHAGGVP